jgi:hypothetical protein
LFVFFPTTDSEDEEAEQLQRSGKRDASAAAAAAAKAEANAVRLASLFFFHSTFPFLSSYNRLVLLFAKAEAAAKRAKLPSPDELFERGELAKPKFLTTAIEVKTLRGVALYQLRRSCEWALLYCDPLTLEINLSLFSSFSISVR